MSDRPLVAITLGDPSGVGPEVVAKALAEPVVHEHARLFVVGDAEGRRTPDAILVREWIGGTPQDVGLQLAVYADLGRVGAADRAQTDHIRLVVRQNDPVSLPRPHQRVGSLALHAYNSLRPTARTPHRSR